MMLVTADHPPGFGLEQHTETMGTSTETTKKQCRGVTNLSFPMKLHTLLEDAARLGFDDVVCWQAGGTSFKVLQPKRFEDEVMKLYFQKTKYKSFQRQLNIYGFRRFHHGKFKGGYHHPSFAQASIPGPHLTRKPRLRNSNNSLPSKQLLASAVEAIVAVEEFPIGKELPSSDADVALYGEDFDESSALAMNEILSDFLLGYEDELLPFPNSSFTEDSLSGGEQLQLENLDPKWYDHPKGDTISEDDSQTKSPPSHSGNTTNIDDNMSTPSSSDRFFPAKLYIMLEDSEKEKFSDIVSWVQSGKAFKVHKRKEFVEKVMPNYFDQTQFESFRRQVRI